MAMSGQVEDVSILAVFLVLASRGCFVRNTGAEHICDPSLSVKWKKDPK